MNTTLLLLALVALVVLSIWLQRYPYGAKHQAQYDERRGLSLVALIPFFIAAKLASYLLPEFTSVDNRWIAFAIFCGVYILLIGIFVLPRRYKLERTTDIDAEILPWD